MKTCKVSEMTNALWAPASNVVRKLESNSLLFVLQILLLQYIYIVRFYVRVSELTEDIPACRHSAASSHRFCSISAGLFLHTSGVQRGERGGWTLVHAQKMPWPDPSSSEKVIGLFLLCLTFFVNLGTTSDSDSVSLQILCLSADFWMSCSSWQRPPFQVKVGSTC